jgi:hypothetical protein
VTSRETSTPSPDDLEFRIDEQGTVLVAADVTGVQPLGVSCRPGSMRALPMITLLLVAATACGSPAGSAGLPACTNIGTPLGVGIDLQPAIAAKVSGATLVACWAGDCTTRKVELYPSTAAGPTSCTGDKQSDACSAQMTPTGGKHGFADLPGLPAAPVRGTVTFSGFAEQTLDVTPTMSYPNGPACGPGGPQARLVVDDNGWVTERR